MTHTGDEIRRLREALLDATAHLAGAASAYRQYARRYTGIRPKAETDAFFSTRVVDFDNAVERARKAVKEARLMSDRLTKEQAAIIGAFTGICAGPFGDIHELAEKLLGCSICTHEFSDKAVWTELKEASRPLFLEIVHKESEDA